MVHVNHVNHLQKSRMIEEHVTKINVPKDKDFSEQEHAKTVLIILKEVLMGRVVCKICAIT